MIIKYSPSQRTDNTKKVLYGAGGVSKCVVSTNILPNLGQKLQSTAGRLSSFKFKSTIILGFLL